MNVTLKSICALARQDNPDLQQAAIRVLGAMRLHDANVSKVLGELLVSTSNPILIEALLEAFERNPNEYALKYILKIVDREDEFQDRVLAAIALVGSKAVLAIKQQFDRVAPKTRQQLVYVLARIRTTAAHQLLIECFFRADHDLVREAVHALREEIHLYQKRERQDLYSGLETALKDKRLAKNESAQSALLIALGILAEVKAQGWLLAYTNSKHPEKIRRHALISLACLPSSGNRHQEVFLALLPILEEQNYEGIVRHAVAVLLDQKPRRADSGKYQKLLRNQHVGVQALAIQMLGRLDNLKNVEMVLEFIRHKEARLRDVATAAIRKMPSAVPVILKRLDEVRNSALARDLVRLLEAHGNRIKKDKAREMAKHLVALFQAQDKHYKLYLTALRHLDSDTLGQELVAQSRRAWKKRDFSEVCAYLGLLEDTGLLAPETLFQLAVAGVKTSRKVRSRSARVADPCLGHIASLLREDPKGFRRRFLAEEVLDEEDFLYVGYHFSEHKHEERRFGGDLLRYVIRKWSRRKSAQVARQKLKAEGH